MLGCIKQIVKCYEDGMSPEEIAEDQDLDITAVKVALSQNSPLYRKAAKAEEKLDPEAAHLNFDEEQLRRVNQVIYDTALGAELPDGSPDFRTRLKAAQYIRDDVKGRLNPVKALNQQNTFNIVQFNEEIKRARIQATQAKRSIEDKRPTEIVEVETV